MLCIGMGVLGFAKFSHCIFMRTPVLVANISESSAVIHASLALAPRYRSALANMWQYQPWPRSQTGTSLGSKHERAWRQMEVPKIWGSTKVGTKETQRALQVKRARGTRQRRYLQDMAQESDSSTPSSSSESGWKCSALATFATKCNNDSPSLESLWFRRHSKIHDAAVKLCSGPPAMYDFYDFFTLLGKNILTSHHIE